MNSARSSERDEIVALHEAGHTVVLGYSVTGSIMPLSRPPSCTTGRSSAPPWSVMTHIPHENSRCGS